MKIPKVQYDKVVRIWQKRLEKKRSWLLEYDDSDAPNSYPPAPKEQIASLDTYFQTHRPPVTAEQLKEVRNTQLVIRLPKEVKLTRVEQREIISFVRQLVKGYRRVDGLLLPQERA